MPKKYKILWSETAENDLLKIIEYIAQDSPSNALNILEKIKEKVADLSFFPEKCRIVPELYNQGITLYREMVISPWRVQYRIADSQVFVLSVLDSRQNIEDILLKRFTQHIF
jgi:plasmid stabilization system protein ParE